MRFRYSQILVTGGAGFIGSHIADRLLNEGLEVTVIDNLHTGRLENVVHNQHRKNFHLIKGNILNFDLIKGIMKNLDAVFHIAALSSVPLSVKNPILTNEVNVKGTLNLLKACLNSSIKRFISASSASIYGETENLPINENAIPRPASPYAVSKLASEKYIQVFCHAYGLETVCLRYFNVYGPRQAHNQYSGVIATFTNQILNNQPPTIHGDGNQTRDFVNIKDVVDANMLALKRKNAVGESFNIATGKAVTINQLAKELLKICGKDLKPVYIDPRPCDIRYSYADISKARRVLGYEPKITLKKGLTEFVEWVANKQI